MSANTERLKTGVQVSLGILLTLMITGIVGGILGYFIQSSLVFGILIGAWVMLLLAAIVFGTYWSFRLQVAFYGFLTLFFMWITQNLTH